MATIAVEAVMRTPCAWLVAAGMALVLPGHPVLTGVSSFSGGTAGVRPRNTALHSGSSVVATWADPSGSPLIVTRTIGSAGVRHSDLGLLPATTDTGRADFVDASSDAMLIVANALRWVGGDL